MEFKLSPNRMVGKAAKFGLELGVFEADGALHAYAADKVRPSDYAGTLRGHFDRAAVKTLAKSSDPEASIIEALK